jgi:hypothetical protein
MSFQSTESVVSSFFLFFYLLSYTVTFSILSFSLIFLPSCPTQFFALSHRAHCFCLRFPRLHLFSVPLIFFFFLLMCVSVRRRCVPFLCLRSFLPLCQCILLLWSVLFLCGVPPDLTLFSSLQILRLPFNQQVFHASFPCKTSFFFSATPKCNTLQGFFLDVITHVTGHINNQ